MRADGDWDLIPGRIGLAPIGCRPALVQIIQGLVLLCQILLEQLTAVVAVTNPAELVVDLPADDVWVCAKVFRHGRDHARGSCVHFGGIDAVMAAVAKLHSPSIIFHGQNFGMLLDQPGRRRSGGGS